MIDVFSDELMAKFEKKLLSPRLAILSKCKYSNSYNLCFQLCPFYYAHELIDSNISFEGLELPSPFLKDLLGLTFVFDENECDAFNGCFTIKSIHNPVDLYQLAFIESRDGYLKVIAKIKIDFEFEQFDDFENLELVINATVASQIL